MSGAGGRPKQYLLSTTYRGQTKTSATIKTDDSVIVRFYGPSEGDGYEIEVTDYGRLHVAEYVAGKSVWSGNIKVDELVAKMKAESAGAETDAKAEQALEHLEAKT
jgi:hypothetical protein